MFCVTACANVIESGPFNSLQQQDLCYYRPEKSSLMRMYGDAVFCAVFLPINVRGWQNVQVMTAVFLLTWMFSSCQIYKYCIHVVVQLQQENRERDCYPPFYIQVLPLTQVGTLPLRTTDYYQSQESQQPNKQKNCHHWQVHPGSSISIYGSNLVGHVPDCVTASMRSS